MLCPLQEGYSFATGNNLRQQATEGGLPRQVPFFVGAVHAVSVSVLLKNANMREYFWAFWRDKQRKPENWKWQLSLDSGGLEDCECRFNADSVPAESMRNGIVIKISFQLYVKPIRRDPNNDRNIIELWQSGAGGNVDDIEKIPNVWMPDALGVNT